jgi:alanyl-tRNA synthetase
MTADALRRAFLSFFEAKGHVVMPSSSLIPQHPKAPLLTNAGMNQFIPVFLGEEPPPHPRVTTVQKCFRTQDIDIIGTTSRHLTFFEMLGNFSLGDYFKADAIPFAWEFVTNVLGFDPDRLWVTVFETDDEAADIWHEAAGVPRERIQRMGEKDNFWAMGPVGPCGPCSEIYFDRGPEWGDGGGPAHGAEERYVEVWNLVFMQYDRDGDGELHDLPARNIDTGAGLDRLLAVLNQNPSVFETDVMRPIVRAAEDVTGTAYGASERTDVSLRILAEHARAASFLVNDGVNPSNEDRGYVLRRIIRRAVRHSVLLDVEDGVMGPLVDATVAAMGSAYPDLVKNADFVREVIDREEQRFRRTLHRGLEMLEERLAEGDISGKDAFFLHDTLGFPVDLTREIAEERRRAVDLVGFESLMAQQRSRAKEAQAAATGAAGHGLAAPPEVYRRVLEEGGSSEFTGYASVATEGCRVLALVVDGRPAATAAEGDAVEVVLDRTPFYAEAGGQVGDTGLLENGDGTTRIRVDDTQWAIAGSLIVHRGAVEQGEVRLDDELVGRVEGTRRDLTRRNHTGTHLLHWALREVLGDHVRQQGSYVGPDRLRFDFSHFEAVSPSALADVEAMANAEVLENAPVRTYETTREHAESVGALAFFGDKYGELVRVVEAGEHSVELCGGTHVHATGSVGPIKVLGEGSIGANIRRVEALTASTTLAFLHDQDTLVRHLAATLRVGPTAVAERVERLQETVRELEDELKTFRAGQLEQVAADLAAGADGAVVVEVRDGLSTDAMRQLAVFTRERLGRGVVVILGRTDDAAKAGIAAAVSKDLQDQGVSAADVVADAARALGGGTAKSADVVVGGGKNPDAVGEAVALAQARADQAVRDATG